MFAIVVRVTVKPGARDAFIAVATDDARSSTRDEPGCLRFDVLQSSEDPDTFMFYEVYRDSAALEAHRQTPHYKRWQEHGVPLLAGPAVVSRAQTVFPADAAWR